MNAALIRIGLKRAIQFLKRIETKLKQTFYSLHITAADHVRDSQ